MTAPSVSQTLEKSVIQVAGGASLVLIGSALVQLLGLAARVLTARTFTVHEFGLLALGLSIVAFAQPIAELGFGGGLPRSIGFFRGRQDYAGLKGSMLTALLLTTAVGLLLSLSMLLGAEYIASLMSAPDLAPVLRILALTTTCLATSTVLVSFFRGFDRVKEKLLFDDLVPNGVKTLAIVIVIVLQAPFGWVVGAYLMAAAVKVVALLLTSAKKMLPVMASVRPRWSAGKEVLLFALPLLGSSQLQVVSKQTNALFLGFFLSPSDVGLYSAAVLVASTIAIFHGAMRFLFLPVSSRLVGAAQLDDLRKLYRTVSKWVIVISFPIAALLIVLPSVILQTLFGPSYLPAAPSLQILAAGQLVGIWLGPNNLALIALGHSRHVFWSFTISNLLALGLGVTLVSQWGILGAALAAAISALCSNLFVSYHLYRIAKIHPVSKATLIMSAAMGGAMLLIGASSTYLAGLPLYLLLPLLLLGFLVIALASTLFFHDADGIDQHLWDMLLGRIRTRLAS